MLLFIRAVFVLQLKQEQNTGRGDWAKQWKFSVRQSWTFETEVANFENDIASEKRP